MKCKNRRISDIYSNFGKNQNFKNSIDFRYKLDLRKNTVSQDYKLLKKFHNANKKNQRQILEWIYDKGDNNKKKEKIILTKQQMNELIPLKNKEESPQEKEEKIKKIQMKKISSKFFEQKESKLTYLRLKNSKSNKNLRNYSMSSLLDRTDIQFKRIYNIVNKSIKMERYYECFSKSIYIDFSNFIQ